MKKIAQFIGSFIAAILMCNPQGMARSASDALATAQCVRMAIKDAQKLLSPTHPGDEKSEQRRKEISLELNAVSRKETEGVKRCMTETDVRSMGWFSYIEDYVAECDLFSTAALENHRQEDDADSDLIDGSASWAALPKEAERLNEHPFFAGQFAAREKFSNDVQKHSYEAICRDLMSGFGPEGNRFPGLVSRSKLPAMSQEGKVPAASDEEVRFAKLYRDFRSFRDTQKFKDCGFAACGYQAWLKDNQALVDSSGLATLSRCEMVPGDLMMLGMTSINATSKADRHYVKTTDAKLEDCAEKIENSTPHLR